MELAELRSAFADQELFEGKTWRLSPEPWKLTPAMIAEFEAIGQASLDFYKAFETLYLRSAAGKKILRNKELFTPWVAEYLDRGKPEALIELSRSKGLKGVVPPVIRPDLLVTENGFSLTELDSVPGGIGLTGYLNKLYQESGNDRILGSEGKMESAWYESMASLAPDKNAPVVAIAVSEEAGTYKPEMDWLADRLQRKGFRVYSLWTEQLFPLGDGVYFDIEGNPERVDVVYRFFELFDLKNIGVSDYLLDSWEAGELQMAPAYRPFYEEKLGLALYHHHLLQEFWKENLSKASRRVLDKLIPKSWVLDPTPLPPGAVFDGPLAQGRQLHDWMDLAEASQKERNLVLKISGFHETAWGSRSVTVGDDVSKEHWKDALAEACEMFGEHPFIIQEFRKSVRLKHPVYSDEGEVYEAVGRLRLNPYYFVVGDEVKLAGALATFCPPDKKIIHGMEDAVMLPCQVV
ncbi:MAG: hypothetical protein AAGB46_10075 [Verrucomicrobiota bacterium]